VSISYLKPGKGQQWRQLYNKYTKPVMEQLLSDGTLLGYGIDREYVHTESPGARYEWLIARDAGALDKVDAAFEAARAKHSAEAGRAIAAEFAEAQEPGTHRDALTQIIDWKRK
jgi:hypothetical protein